MSRSLPPSRALAAGEGARRAGGGHFIVAQPIALAHPAPLAPLGPVLLLSSSREGLPAHLSNYECIMTDTPKHSRRKRFVTPELTLFGQVDRIVMQSPPPNPEARVSGRGNTKTRTPGDWFGN